ncbi:MAG: sel1 repeat family protein [Rhodobacteraceae bacterium]|jgi:hypothetical protein|nr:sel1 repeat family protein [Paracoccaceae bacterium]
MRAGRLGLVLGLFMGVLATPAAAQSVPETDCDRQAGLWLMPRAEGMAQAYAIADPGAAVAACETAVADYPQEPFFAVLLARAMVAAQPDDARALAVLDDTSQHFPALFAGQLAQLYEQGLAGLPTSDRLAGELFFAACEHAPDPFARPGCAGLAVMMIEGRGGPADEIRGFAMLENLCNGDWPMACTDLALQRELYGGASEPEIAGFLALACEGGDLLGCSLLGFRHEVELGVPHDMARARALYQRACDGGEVHGCANLGEVFRSGLGVAPDVAQAVQLFDRACRGNDPYACATLGSILADGRGVPMDVVRAIEVYDRACWLGDPEACDWADSLR